MSPHPPAVGFRTRVEFTGKTEEEHATVYHFRVTASQTPRLTFALIVVPRIVRVLAWAMDASMRLFPIGVRPHVTVVVSTDAAPDAPG